MILFLSSPFNLLKAIKAFFLFPLFTDNLFQTSSNSGVYFILLLLLLLLLLVLRSYDHLLLIDSVALLDFSVAQFHSSSCAGQ